MESIMPQKAWGVGDLIFGQVQNATRATCHVSAFWHRCCLHYNFWPNFLIISVRHGNIHFLVWYHILFPTPSWNGTPWIIVILWGRHLHPKIHSVYLLLLSKICIEFFSLWDKRRRAILVYDLKLPTLTRIYNLHDFVEGSTSTWNKLPEMVWKMVKWFVFLSITDFQIQ